jgi:hypothetical protein
LSDRMLSSVEGVGVDGRKDFVVAESVASVVGSSGLVPSPKIITVAVDAIAQGLRGARGKVIPPVRRCHSLL